MTSVNCKSAKQKANRAGLTDHSIQGTNDSSIVSKRSVERIYWSEASIKKAGYHPDIDLGNSETNANPDTYPHADLDSRSSQLKLTHCPTEWFRFFVKKPVRRSPIINRGYWVRMHAMTNVVKSLIQSEHSSTGPIVVVNLGCGFDPYPYQFLESDQQLLKTQNVHFLDIDYPDLIRNKVNIIKESPEIIQVIGGESRISYHLPVSSEPISKSKTKANAKIKANFPDHAINSNPGKAINGPGFYLEAPNYACLGCDLRNLEQLSDLLSQKYGLSESTFLFTAEVSLTYMDNPSADNLIRWASLLPQAHFVLLEQIMPAGPLHPFAQTMLKHFNSLGTPLGSIDKYETCSKQVERFSTWKHVQASDLYNYWCAHVSLRHKAYLDKIEDFDELEEFILFCQHYVILQASNKTSTSLLSSQKRSTLDGTPRIGTTITLNGAPLSGVGTTKATKARTLKRKFFASANLNEHSVIINGGSSTTREASSLLLTTEHQPSFVELADKLDGRVCHQLTSLNSTSLVLTGGRHSPSCPQKSVLKFDQGLHRWLESSVTLEHAGRFRHCAVALNENEILVFGGCQSSDEEPWMILGPSGVRYLKSAIPNRKGSVLVWDSPNEVGYLIGGLGDDNEIKQDVYKISVQVSTVESEKLIEHPLLCRYGADAVINPDNTLFIAGGVSSEQLYDNNNYFVSVALDTGALYSHYTDMLPIPVGFRMSRIDHKLLFVGGGAVCFSFGSYWNDVYVVDSTLPDLQLVSPTKEATFPSELSPRRITTASEFAEVYMNYIPVLFENQNLGRCTELWKTPQYLIEKIGKDREVIVHVSEDAQLNFQVKNFQYSTMKFEEFLDHMFNDKTASVYLRSLSKNDPRNRPAMFQQDFKEIAQDFQLPEPFAHVQKKCFSSPLRLSSSNTSIWLHYDVTANILCQIVGTKTLRLYPPSDVQYLDFPIGSSSSTILNIFEHHDARTHPIDVVMEPGSIIYIPPMWLHAVKCLEPSISLNFFWKDLPKEAYAKGRDVYGNHDLESYEQGRKQIGKIAGLFDGLPSDIKTFYLLKLADELKNSVNS